MSGRSWPFHDEAGSGLSHRSKRANALGHDIPSPRLNPKEKDSGCVEKFKSLDLGARKKNLPWYGPAEWIIRG